MIMVSELDNAQVCILLATYNGEKYIEQQIDSIINQTHSTWRLIIRDDGSSDNTLSILKKIISKDKRIELLVDEKSNLGAFRNFHRLTEYAVSNYNPEYVLYSDQDDLWNAEKVECLLKEIVKHENGDRNKPILVHSNYQLSDQDLNPLLHNSFRDNASMMDRRTSFLQTVFQNNVYGCTSIVNRALLISCMHNYFYCDNHDHWMSLNASWYGRIFYLNAKCMLYRQHDMNVSGSVYTRKSYFSRIISLSAEVKRESLSILKSILYLDIFRKIKNERAFLSLNESTGKPKVSFKIITFCLKNRIEKNSFHETAFFYFCLFYSLLTNFRVLQTELSKCFLIENSRISK